MKNNLFRPMSETEISINMIENIRMVHIYDLTGGNGKSVNDFGCAAIAVYYGNNEQINLSEVDECFGILVNKVFDIYNLLQDKSVIQMDDNTRAFLDNGIVFNNDERLATYFNLDPLDNPVLAIDSTLSKRFMPLVEYLVVGINKIFNINYHVTKREAGWRGAFLISGYIGDDINNEKIVYSKAIKKDDSNFAIIVNNFLRENEELIVNVIISGDKIEINYMSEKSLISGKSSFAFDLLRVRETHILYQNNKQIFYDVNDYESLNESDVKSANINTFFNENISAIYKLPFDLIYVLYNEKHKIGNINTEVISGEFIWSDGIFSEIRGWTNVHNQESNITIRSDSIWIINTRLKDKNVQTFFVTGENNSSWQYKNKLAGRYFIGGN